MKPFIKYLKRLFTASENRRANKKSRSKIKNVLVVDPIAFFGGSKVASQTLLNELKKRGYSITVASTDINSWEKSRFKIIKIKETSTLAQAEQATGYYLKHLCIFLQLMIHIILSYVLHSRKYSAIIGISGPGVDISIYWTSLCLFIPSVQLIHGPVAHSRLINFFIRKASLIASLDSELADLKKRIAIPKSNINTTANITTMHNGIGDQQWPTTTRSTFNSPRLYWCASLLKWKGLERFLASIQQLQAMTKFHAEINYIAPKASQQACSEKPTPTHYLDVIEQPSDIDKRRAACNIFVSTSTNEPFGLSILEALCAGLCVVIPADGAYWDQRLEHGKNCIKYQAASSDLTKQLHWLCKNMTRTKKIAENGKKIARAYRATHTYKQALNAIELVIADKPKQSQPSLDTKDELLAIKKLLHRFPKTYPTSDKTYCKHGRNL